LTEKSAELLAVDGLCAAPRTFDWRAIDELAVGEALVEATERLSPKVRGEGVRLAALLDVAGAEARATHVVVADDGDYRACLTRAEAEAAVVAHRQDGAPLPEASGGPLRLLVPTSDNACLSVKRVSRITLTDAPVVDTVPRPVTPLGRGR
jgi:DMSO/TMAO reductase YedYZ molybdopterin-dependent catalytic subunit